MAQVKWVSQNSIFFRVILIKHGFMHGIQHQHENRNRKSYTRSIRRDENRNQKATRGAYAEIKTKEASHGAYIAKNEKQKALEIIGFPYLKCFVF